MKCCFCCSCYCCYCCFWSHKPTFKVWLKLGQEQLRYWWHWVSVGGGGWTKVIFMSHPNFWVELRLSWGCDNINTFLNLYICPLCTVDPSIVKSLETGYAHFLRDFVTRIVMLKYVKMKVIKESMKIKLCVYILQNWEKAQNFVLRKVKKYFVAGNLIL